MKNKKMSASNLTRKKTIWGSLISVGIMGVTAWTAFSIASCSCNNGGGDIPPEPVSGDFKDIIAGTTIGKMDFTSFQLSSSMFNVNDQVNFNNSGAFLSFYYADMPDHYDIILVAPGNPNKYIYDADQGDGSGYKEDFSIKSNGRTFSWTFVDLTLTISSPETVSSTSGDIDGYVGGTWYE